MKLNKTISIAIFILSILLSFGLFVFRDNFKEASSLGLFGIFLINFLSGLSFFLPAPSFLTVFSGGAVYPPILVALVSSLGATLGDMIYFVMGYTGRMIISAKIENKILYKTFQSLFKKYGTLIVFVLALIPNPLFDGIGLVAGVFTYSPYKFFIVVMLGRFLRYFLLAGVGSYF